MNKPIYTPGPWKADEENLFIFGPQMEMIAMMRGDGQDLPIPANAKLLSAAPNLVDALERVWDSRHEPDKWSLEVSRALETATGIPHPFRSAREELARKRT